MLCMLKLGHRFMLRCVVRDSLLLFDFSVLGPSFVVMVSVSHAHVPVGTPFFSVGIECMFLVGLCVALLRARLAPPLGITLDHLACNLSAAMAVLSRGGGRSVAREASDGA